MGVRAVLRRLLAHQPAKPADDLEGMFRRVVEQSPDVICRISQGKFTYVSPSVFSTFGFEPQSWIGADGLSVVLDEDRHVVVDLIERLVSGRQEQAVCQARIPCADGSVKWVETTVRDEAGEAILVMRDITVRKRLEEELATLALQDGLTGLANRRAFDQALDGEWRKTLRTGGEMALVLLDVDFFKQFNDLQGHQAGDDCLRAVAACVQDLARRPTDIACRYGGEELVVILGDTGLEGALTTAETMRARVAALAIPHGGSACADHVTVSIGVAAAFARSGGSMDLPEGLLQAADHALYKAKAGGRNRVEQAILIAPADEQGQP